MQDHFSKYFEWDDVTGKLRKKRERVAGDGEQIHFPVTVMDHAAFGFQPTFSDGSPDHTSPHRPGYRFLDIGDADRLAADAAYAERSKYLEAAWRHRDNAGLLGSPLELDKHGLPDAAKALYMSVFQTYASEGDTHANAAAWKAVKRRFVKNQAGEWVARTGDEAAALAYADKVQHMRDAWKDKR